MKYLRAIILLSFCLVAVVCTAQKDFPSVPESGDNDTTVYDLVEHMPTFPGGTDSLFSFIRANLTYPEEAQEQKIEGRIYVSFIVEKDGSITNVGLHENYDIGGGCGPEGIRVVRSMPNWLPGNHGGNNLRFIIVLPIMFLLSEHREYPTTVVHMPPAHLTTP